MSIETGILSDAIKHIITNDDVDPLSANQMELSRSNISMQFKKFCKRHANLAVGEYNTPGSGGSNSSIFAAVMPSLRANINSVVDVYSKQLIIDNKACTTLNNISNIYKAAEASVGLDAMSTFKVHLHIST